MPTYCVNTVAQPYSRDHEVHNLDSGCSYLPAPANRLALGWQPGCRDAVAKAKQTYSDVNGCAYCCPECHTT
jgi:hypothetical protein